MRLQYLGALLWAMELFQPAVALNSIVTVTVSINTAVCPASTGLPPSSSPIVIAYTTTNSLGSVITTSTTSYVTPPPSSSSVIVYTTTNSMGSTIITSTTSILPPISSTSSSTATYAAPPGPESPCPASIAALYQTAAGRMYELFCSSDFLNQDLPAYTTSNLEACLAACDAYVPAPATDFGDIPCVGVTWVLPQPNGANCYLKSGIENVTYALQGVDSAKLISYNPPSIIVSVSGASSVYSTTLGGPTGTIPIGSSTTTTSTGTISTSLSTNSQSLSSSSITSTASSTTETSSTGSTSLTSSATSTSSTSSQTSTLLGSSTPISSSTSNTLTTSSTLTSSSTTSSTCPPPGPTIYQSTPTRPYQILYNVSVNYADIIFVNTSTFDQCVSACDNYIPTAPGDTGDVPCVAVSWLPYNPNGDNCYLHSSGFSTAPNIGYESGILLTNCTYSSTSSTTSSTSSALPIVSGTSSTTSSSTQTPSSISLSVSSTSSITGSSTSTPSTSSLVSSTSSTTSGTTTPTTTSPSTTVGFTCTSTPSVSCSSTQTIAPPCQTPSNNGTIIESPENTPYKLVCGAEIRDDDLPPINVCTFDQCLEACDNYTPCPGQDSYNQPCVAISFEHDNSLGANCFLHFGVDGNYYYGASLADSAIMVSYLNSNATPLCSTSGGDYSNKTYQSSERPYNIQCGTNIDSDNLPGGTFTTSTFEDCISECDAWVPSSSNNYLPCNGANFVINSNQCYLKSNTSVTETDQYTTNVDTAILVTNSTTITTSITTSSTSSTVTTSSTTSSTSLTAAQSSAEVPCPAADNSDYTSATNSARSYEIQCSSYINATTSTNTPSTGFEDCIAQCDAQASPPCIGVTYNIVTGGSNCFLASAIDSLAPSGSSQNDDAAILITSSTTTTTVSTSSTSTLTTSSTTSSTSLTASQSALPCPAGGTYQSPTNVSRSYTIDCGTAITLGNLSPTYTSNGFEDCIAFCDAYVPATTGPYANLACIAADYLINTYPNNCYLKANTYTSTSASTTENSAFLVQ